MSVGFLKTSGIVNYSKSRSAKPAGIILSGGVVTTDGTYSYRAFTSSGTLSVANGTLSADILVVAGGGAAGISFGAGGGGGGMLEFYDQELSPGSYTCTIGAGGPPPASGLTGDNGSNSQFQGLTATIGGGGGGGPRTTAGRAGGSGGGGCGAASGGAGTAGQGNAGGNGTSDSGGGGGGKGSAGSGRNGGHGATSVIAGNTSYGVLYNGSRYFAGGGGGVPLGTNINGANSPATAGQVNSGQGAGGDDFVPGGSGIIIVRYLNSQV